MHYVQNSSAIAAALIENGYMPVPIPLGQKGPRTPSGPNCAFTAVDFPGSYNIGIRCGDAGVATLSSFLKIWARLSQFACASENLFTN